MSDLQHISEHSAGDPIPANCEVIEVHVAELKQLFNAIDPSPFREKDLDPDAEDFIVSWASELSHDAPLALLVHLDRPRAYPKNRSFCETQSASSSVIARIRPDNDCVNYSALAVQACSSASRSLQRPSAWVTSSQMHCQDGELVKFCAKVS